MILKSLRFDDDDVVTLISSIFDEFIANCQKYYKIGEITTTDEMLVLEVGVDRKNKCLTNHVSNGNKISDR